jgi:pantothenate kinase
LNKTDLATVVASRLEDMATQVECLYANGFHEEAAVLREEGLMLAQAFDNEETFFFLGSTFAQ